MKKEFITGKWYRAGNSNIPKDDYFIKFKFRSNNQIYYTERIFMGEYEKIKDYWCNHHFTDYALNHECNINDILPFLPPYHLNLIQYKTYELW